MNVSDLIANWTEEERRQHANLIMDCLKREQLLLGLSGRIRASEEELKKSLDRLLTGLNNLAEIINASEDRWQNIYLYLAKGKGNA
jgi:hypothetical protein